MTNDLSHNVIRFFKECYESDNRETNIAHLFSKKIDAILPLTVEQEGMLAETRSMRILQSEFAPIHDLLEKYKREKKLVFAGSYIVFRKLNLKGKVTSYCAPLILFDVEVAEHIEEDEIDLTLKGFQWNFPILREFVDDNTRLDELDKLYNEQKSLALNLENFARWFEGLVEDQEIKIIENGDLETLKKMSRGRKRNLVQLANCGVLAVVARSVNTRGIIHELERLGKEMEPSKVLKQLLTGKLSNVSNVLIPDFHSLPGILSEAQQQILVNASTKRLSQVIGPPGTGKSYTIAHIAIDRFLNGESVLVVSQNEHAINVIQKNLSQKLGISSKGVVRTGASQYHKSLKKYVSDLLNNIKPPRPEIKPVFGEKFLVKAKKTKQYEPQKELKKLKQDIIKLEETYIHESEKAVKAGLKLDNYLNLESLPKLIARVGLWLADTNFNTPDLLFQVIDRLHGLYLEREMLVAQLIGVKYENRLNDILQDDIGRKKMVKFQSVLKARSSSRQELMLEQTDYKEILKVLPIWLSSLEGLHKSLPLQKELFDLVIIDEATQCDIASCLPAIHRAKRLVVVGDPEQLRHISFLSRSKQNLIRSKHGLDDFEIDLNFRDESIIDIINHNLRSSQDVVMLDEHYRGLPKLIEFSNKKFYGDSLKIMTEKPLMREESPISIKFCKGLHQKGVNEIEAEEVINYLKKIIENQEELPKQYKLSIGVLAFYRNQAELLQNKILELLPEQIANHHLRAGTPYAFQGEERDIMLISCCVDDKSHWGSYQFLNWTNMFNVAITRAKSTQVLFVSANMDEMPKNNLLKEYLTSIKNQTSKAIKHEDLQTEDLHLTALKEAFQKKKIKLVQNFVLAGVSMDLVAIYKNNSIAIDLIGFPGKYEEAFALNRYKIFDRAGFRIFPITLNEWRYKREEILDRVSKELKNKVKEEDVHVTLQSLSDKWPLLLKFNPQMAKEVRLIEIDLIEMSDGRILQQLGLLIESYHKLIKVLTNKLQEGEHTFTRYKSAADSVLEMSIDTYKKISAIQQSIPALSEFEISHPNKLLLNEQKTLINHLLQKNEQVILSLQTIALNWSSINTKSSNQDAEGCFKELERLNHQIKLYNK